MCMHWCVHTCVCMCVRVRMRVRVCVCVCTIVQNPPPCLNYRIPRNKHYSTGNRIVGNYFQKVRFSQDGFSCGYIFADGLKYILTHVADKIHRVKFSWVETNPRKLHPSKIPALRYYRGGAVPIQHSAIIARALSFCK